MKVAEDLSRLQEAVAGNKMDDTLSRFMPAKAWAVLANYLTCEKVERGHMVIAQGALDRQLYFVESGVLRVHYASRSGELQIALLGPGAVVGEGAFFSEIPRNATVQATQSCVLWCLQPSRFAALVKKEPDTALSLAMALGAVLSTRMSDMARKIAVT